MANGLCIDKNDFMTLPQKEKWGVLYENQLQTLDLIRGYKLSQKIQYTLMSVLLAGMGLLFKFSLGLK